MAYIICIGAFTRKNVFITGYAASITNTYKQSQELMTLQKYSIDKQLNVEQIKSKTKVNVGKKILSQLILQKKNKQ